MKKHILISAIFILSMISAYAQIGTHSEGIPISSKEATEIIEKSKQFNNLKSPYLIYPGDELTYRFRTQDSTIVVQFGDNQKQIVKNVDALISALGPILKPVVINESSMSVRTAREHAHLLDEDPAFAERLYAIHNVPVQSFPTKSPIIPYDVLLVMCAVFAILFAASLFGLLRMASRIENTKMSTPERVQYTPSHAEKEVSLQGRH